MEFCDDDNHVTYETLKSWINHVMYDMLDIYNKALIKLIMIKLIC